MKANLDLDEEQFKIAAIEEKKRRREFSIPLRTLLNDRLMLACNDGR
jgi:hypothetical protein